MLCETTMRARTFHWARAQGPLPPMAVLSLSRTRLGYCPEPALTGYPASPRSRQTVREVPAKVIDHVACVVLDAMDERGLAPPQHGQAEGVHAGAVDDSAVVANVALRVDHRHVEPL